MAVLYSFVLLFLTSGAKEQDVNNNKGTTHEAKKDFNDNEISTLEVQQEENDYNSPLFGFR